MQMPVRSFSLVNKSLSIKSPCFVAVCHIVVFCRDGDIEFLGVDVIFQNPVVTCSHGGEIPGRYVVIDRKPVILLIRAAPIHHVHPFHRVTYNLVCFQPLVPIPAACLS